jgi:MFS family permease
MLNEGETSGPGSGRALAVVSIAMVACISPWLAGSAVAPELALAWQLDAGESALLTTAVQLGFVVGTFFFAFFNLADVFNPRIVFFLSALAGAACNAAFALASESFIEALVWRLLTGASFAGVYPVGMKIIAGWFRHGLGWRLSVVIGAFTLGTAAPWLVAAVDAELPWRTVVLTASVAALLGGVLVLAAAREGPYLRTRARFSALAMFRVFRYRPFRLSALAYFGHNWELYALWSLAVFFMSATGVSRSGAAWVSFALIAAGAVGCVAGGWLSRLAGERRVALWALAASGVCCALTPLVFDMPPWVLGVFFIAWGVFAVADSAQFASLAARTCPSEYTATALTAMNMVGYTLTILSIQLVPLMADAMGWRWAFLVLVPGPVLGVLCLARLRLTQH